MGLNSFGTVPQAIAQSPETLTPASEEATLYLRPKTLCPSDLPTLMAGLLRDLPSYANRAASRSLGSSQEVSGFGTILVAGQAEFAPLDVAALTSRETPTAIPEAIEQVFFTTLERYYTTTEAIQLEQYHWLLLTPVEDGWRFALMFSRVAVDGASERPPTPPRESSDGIIGQAVRLWLRDCRAGAVYPVDPPTESVISPATEEKMGR